MLKRIGAEESGEFKAVASGTLPSGKPVVVNADGTVSVVAETGTAGASGTKVAFDGAPTEGMNVVFDSSNNKIVVIYSDEGNSNYGTAIIGTVDNSDNSISFGTPVVFNSGNSQKVGATFDSNSNKVIALWHQVIGTTGRAIVGTVSGTSISFGSSADFTQNSIDGEIKATFDTNLNKVAVVYTDNGDSSKGKCVIGTVSGTSISFGSIVTFRNAAAYSPDVCFDSNLNCILVFYQSTSNDGYISIGDISGTSVTFTTEINLGHDAERTQCEFDPDTNKVVLAYTDRPDGESAAARTVTIGGSSGSRTASFGSEVNFATGVSQNCAILGIAYDPDADRMLISYSEESGGNVKLASGTVSGTDISFGTPQTIVNEDARVTFAPIVYDTSQDRAVMVYNDYANSYAATAIVATVDTISANITSENYIGMSRGVVAGEPASTGTAVSFESGTTTLSHVAFDSSNNKVVIAYQDAGDSDKGKAVVGTVSGTSISFGSIVQFEGGATANLDCVFDNNSNKVVILFQDNGDSGKGKGIVGTVSGTSISFGSPTQFNSGNDDAYNIAAAFDSSNNKVVVAYRDNGNSDYPTAAVGTVSGTSISFGTPVVVKSVYGDQETVVFDSSNNKVAVGFQTSSSTGEAAVGTVSGTGISFGSSTAFNAGDTTQLAGTFDNSNNKVVFAYRDNSNSNQGTAVVGTISGTSISFGSEVIFNTGNTQGTSAVFDTNVNKVVISYEDRGDSDKGKFIVGTVSGTSISFDTETTFSGSNAVFQTGAAFDSNANKVVIAYANDTDSSDRGEAIVTNIDSLTRAEVASGGNASMDIIGSVSDNQSGLTAGQQYFVQTDGTIGTTAATPSVLAGTAISATELVVKT